MAWTEQCKIDFRQQVEHRKKQGQKIKAILRELSKGAGIPRGTLEEWLYYPDGRDRKNPVSSSSEPLRKPKLAKFNRSNDNIEWAKWTWNPVTGCKHGCSYCYARDFIRRFPNMYPKGFEPHFWEQRLKAPHNTPLPKCDDIRERSVFVCSMADLFGEWVPEEWIHAVLEQVKATPQWNFLFLTKNPKRLLEIRWPENAWVGATVDKQKRVESTEHVFREFAKREAMEGTPRVRFLSCEPLRGRLEFTDLMLFHWIIIGAQSKTSKMSKMQPEREWVESLICDAMKSRVPIYCKPNLRAGIKEYPQTVE